MPSSSASTITDSAPVLERRASEDGYLIEARVEERILTISISGLWNPATARNYRRDLRELTAEMVQRGGYRGALLNASSYPIQLAEIAAEHAAAMTVARQRFGVRAAVLMMGSRPRIQMTRVVRETGHRIFGHRADALDWLLA